MKMLQVFIATALLLYSGMMHAQSAKYTYHHLNEKGEKKNNKSAVGADEDNRKLFDINTFSSPDVASLGKFVDVPPVESNGLLSTRIDLVELKSKSLSLPIELMYHGGGIKVKQDASRVGMGWSLNAGGTISREIRGSADDLWQHYWDAYSPTNLTKDIIDFGRITTQEENVRGIDPVEKFPFLDNASWHWNFDPCGGYFRELNGDYRGYSDTAHMAALSYYVFMDNNDLTSSQQSFQYDDEPDIFKASFGHHSFKFVFDEQGIPKIIGAPQYKIEYHLDESSFMTTDRLSKGGIDWFKITAPNGDTYLFEEKEITDVSTITKNLHVFTDCPSGIMECCNYNVLSQSTIWEDHTQRYTSAWHLTEIRNQENTDLIQLSYSSNESPITSYELAPKSRQDCQMNCYAISGYGVEGGTFATRVVVDSKKLDEISSPVMSIGFQYSSRLDVVGEKKLDKLFVKHGNNELFHYDFTYLTNTANDNPGGVFDFLDELYMDAQNNPTSFHHRVNHPSSNVEYSFPDWLVADNYFSNLKSDLIIADITRLFLSEVQKIGHNNTLDIPPYIFEYKDYYGSQRPNKKSTEVDHWGYYNNNGESSLIPEIFVNPNAEGLHRYRIVSNTNATTEYHFPGADRSANNHAQFGVLTSITYPTGGKQDMTYGLHEFKFEGAPNNEIVQGGGLRIEEVTKDAGAQEYTTKFNYNDPSTSLSSGQAISIPQYATETGVWFDLNNDCIYFDVISGHEKQYYNWTEHQPVLLNQTSLIADGWSQQTKWDRFTRRIALSRVNLFNLDGEAVKYRFVTREKVDNQNVNINGKIVHEYEEASSYLNNSTWVNYMKSRAYGPGPVLLRASDGDDYINTPNSCKSTQDHNLWNDGFSTEKGHNIYPYPPNSRLLDKPYGKLVDEKYYDTSGSLIKSASYVYTKKSSSSGNNLVYGMVTKPVLGAREILSSWSSQTDPKKYGKYTYETETEWLVSGIQTTLDNVVSTVTYTYEDDYFLPESKLTVNSNADLLKEQYYYPHTINYASGHGQYGHMQKHQNEHNISELVKQENFYNNVAIDGFWKEYNYFGSNNYSLPSKMDRLEVAFGNGGTTSSWEEQYEIKEYDLNVLNPSKLRQDGWTYDVELTWSNSAKIASWKQGTHIKSFTHDPVYDNLSSTQDIDGQIINYEYDALQRLEWVKERNNHRVKRYVYSFQPNKVQTFNYLSDQMEQQLIQEFDGLGRLVKTKNVQSASEIIQTYDAAGRLNTETDEEGEITSFTYYPDPLDRIYQTTDPNGFIYTKLYESDNNEFKVTTTDPDGLLHIEYNDILGRKTKMESGQGSNLATTSYEYNDKSQLIKIIPPDASPSDAGLIYEFEYDGADNMVKKKLPDRGQMEYEYDDRNLEIGMRDDNIIAEGKSWLCTRYDAYGRPDRIGFGTQPGNPTETFTFNYYDGDGTGNQSNPIYRGRMDKTTVFILDGFNAGASIITSQYVFDNYGRVQSLDISGPPEYVEDYDYTYFMDDQLHTETHNSQSVTTIKDYTYDNALRVKSENFSLNGETHEIRKEMNYNKRDQLEDQKINDGSYFVDYTYNSNGWLDRINSSNFDFRLYYNSTLTGGTPRKNGSISAMNWGTPNENMAYLFTYDHLNRITDAVSDNNGGYDTHYDYHDQRGNLHLIDRYTMTSTGTEQIDDLTLTLFPGTNRLKSTVNNIVVDCPEEFHVSSQLVQEGIFAAKNRITSDAVSQDLNLTLTAENEAELVGDFEYDPNNIGTLEVNNSPCPDPSVNLAVLLNEDGHLGTVAKDTQRDYEYDGNGNITYDPVKDMEFKYNHFNLPYEVIDGNGNTIEWEYTADGRKLKKLVNNSSERIYLSELEFVDGPLRRVYHSVGHIDIVDGQQHWRYNLDDHLGNTRVLMDDNNQILEEHHYYPFGLEMRGTWNHQGTDVDNSYLYNGKELNSDLGLGLYAYGARMYDPVIGRFTGVDPAAEMTIASSTFGYVENNPINLIDPTGLISQSLYSQGSGSNSNNGEDEIESIKDEGGNKPPNRIMSYLLNALTSEDTKLMAGTGADFSRSLTLNAEIRLGLKFGESFANIKASTFEFGFGFYGERGVGGTVEMFTAGTNINVPGIIGVKGDLDFIKSGIFFDGEYFNWHSSLPDANVSLTGPFGTQHNLLTNKSSQSLNLGPVSVQAGFEFTKFIQKTANRFQDWVQKKIVDPINARLNVYTR